MNFQELFCSLFACRSWNLTDCAKNPTYLWPKHCSHLTCCERVISRVVHFLPQQLGACCGGPSVSGNLAEITTAHSSANAAPELCLERAVWASPRRVGWGFLFWQLQPGVEEFSETEARLLQLWGTKRQNPLPLFSVEFKLKILEEKWCILVARSLVSFIWEFASLKNHYVI